MRWLALLIIGLSLVVGAIAWVAWERWQAPLTVPADGIEVIVAPGQSLASVLEGLRARGVVQYPRVIALYARYTGEDQKIRQGEYHVPTGADAQALLQLLQSDAVIQYQVTLPEGITLGRAVALLAEQPDLQHELAEQDDTRILSLIAPYTHPEGLFFPDSYQYTRGDSDWDILQRAHQRMLDVLQEEWEGRAAKLPYESPYEALIMASIIERETGLASERGTIAGVFVRRLRKGMLLQTDPTIIYGLGDDYQGNIRRHHLTDKANRYNTYRHAGLPPTPIALPGRAAIHAALNPEVGKALYFVARGDGGHVFSATLAEHNKAVRKYQLQHKANYRSSPEPQ